MTEEVVALPLWAREAKVQPSDYRAVYDRALGEPAGF